MKPRNHIYVGGPPLDPPDEPPIIKCTFCGKNNGSILWKWNNGRCPACGKMYAGKTNED